MIVPNDNEDKKIEEYSKTYLYQMTASKNRNQDISSLNGYKTNLIERHLYILGAEERIYWQIYY